MKSQKFFISSRDKKLILSILAKIKKDKNKDKIRIISFDYLFKPFDDEERFLIERFKNINPLKYGFRGRYLGIYKVPANLVAIRNQKYKYKGKLKMIDDQYLPKPVFLAYKKLNFQLREDTKKNLLIGSGYRSPAYQTIAFLRHLSFCQFNFCKTIKRVAIPGYSEHGFTRKQAIDFITADGRSFTGKPLDFAKTIEYKWLIKNADRFGFYLSYPRNNKLGVVFEPWHWHFED